jgi:hypothetical protein
MFWVSSPQSDNNTHRLKQQHHQERYKEKLVFFPNRKISKTIQNIQIEPFAKQHRFDNTSVTNNTKVYIIVKVRCAPWALALTLHLDRFA